MSERVEREPHVCKPSGRAQSAHMVGLCCCVLGLGAQVFPDAAESLGVDPFGAWLLFGFGLFLLATAALSARREA